RHFDAERQWDEFKDPQIVDWKRVRGVIEHENALVNNRITWLLASHGFLFTLLGLSANNSLVASCFRDRSVPIKDGLVASVAMCNAYMFNGLPLLMLLGLAISLIIAITISHAEQQVRAMDSWWHRRYGSLVSQAHPAVFRPRPTLFLGFLFRYSLLASAFAAAWGGGLLYLLVRRVGAIQAFFGGIAPIWYVLAMQLAILSLYLGRGRAEPHPSQNPEEITDPWPAGNGHLPRLFHDWYFTLLAVVAIAFLILAAFLPGLRAHAVFGVLFTVLSLLFVALPKPSPKPEQVAGTRGAPAPERISF
ncbi:MAG: hypothetical protein ACKOPN_07060, partial [Prochlorococcaceae cyanobacterium]